MKDIFAVLRQHPFTACRTRHYVDVNEIQQEVCEYDNTIYFYKYRTGSK